MFVSEYISNRIEGKITRQNYLQIAHVSKPSINKWKVTLYPLINTMLTAKNTNSYDILWKLSCVNIIAFVILKHITKCIIIETHSQSQNQVHVLIVEKLEAFIAVMYAREVKEKSDLLYKTSVMRDGGYHCVKELCLKITSVKFSVFSVLL